jgi:glycosyltransferase involved in cell wall biosynthesis
LGVTVFTLMRAGWPDAVHYVENPLPSRFTAGDVVIVSGAMGASDRWAHLRTAASLQRRVPGLGVVVSDATWHPRASAAESRTKALRPALTRLEKHLLRRLDPALTRYCFLTDAERRSFAEQAGVALDAVCVTPFYPSIEWEPDLPELLAMAEHPEPYIFSGGNATRDFDLLREALGGTDLQVRIATRTPAQSPPANFIEGPVSHGEFLRLMARSSVVVMPLATSSGRSAGQQSYLNSMRLGKPTVVNDALGVSELVGDDAFVVRSDDPRAMRARVEWILRPENAAAVRAVVARGVRLTTQVLTYERYITHISSIARELETAIAPVRS